jgi:hypothetical protein
VNEDERGARIAALETQLVRTVDAHVDALEGRDASTVACTAILSAAVAIALRSTGFDVDRANAMLRDVPWRTLVLAALEDLRARGEVSS